jgi:fimbrial isopeptide formation D2 family protein
MQKREFVMKPEVTGKKRLLSIAVTLTLILSLLPFFAPALAESEEENIDVSVEIVKDGDTETELIETPKVEDTEPMLVLSADISRAVAGKALSPGSFAEGQIEPTLEEIQAAALRTAGIRSETPLRTMLRSVGPVNVSAQIAALADSVQSGKNLYFVVWIKTTGEIDNIRPHLEMNFDFDERYFRFVSATNFYGESMGSFVYDAGTKSGSYDFREEMKSGETYMAVFAFSSKNGITPGGEAVSARVSMKDGPGGAEISGGMAEAKVTAQLRYSLSHNIDVSTYASASLPVRYTLALEVPGVDKSNGSLLLEPGSDVILHVELPPQSVISNVKAAFDPGFDGFVDSSLTYPGNGRGVLTLTYKAKTDDEAQLLANENQLLSFVEITGTFLKYETAVNGDAIRIGSFLSLASVTLTDLSGASHANRPAEPDRVVAYMLRDTPLTGDAQAHVDVWYADPVAKNVNTAGFYDGYRFYWPSGSFMERNRVKEGVSTNTLWQSVVEIQSLGLQFYTPKTRSGPYKNVNKYTLKQSFSNSEKREFVYFRVSLYHSSNFNTYDMKVTLRVDYTKTGVSGIQQTSYTYHTGAGVHLNRVGVQEDVDARIYVEDIFGKDTEGITILAATAEAERDDGGYVSDYTRCMLNFGVGYIPKALGDYTDTITSWITVDGVTYTDVVNNDLDHVLRVDYITPVVATVAADTETDGGSDELPSVGAAPFAYKLTLSSTSSNTSVETLKGGHYLGIAVPDSVTLSEDLSDAEFVKIVSNYPTAGEKMYIYKSNALVKRGETIKFSGEIRIDQRTPRTFEIKAYYLNDKYPKLNVIAGYSDIELERRAGGGEAVFDIVTNENNDYVTSRKLYAAGQNPHAFGAEIYARGNMDENWTVGGEGNARASTQAKGGYVDYRIDIHNMAPTVLKGMYIVSMFPAPDDIGLTDNASFGSAFRPYLAGPVSIPGATVYYTGVSVQNMKKSVELGLETSVASPEYVPDGAGDPNWRTEKQWESSNGKNYAGVTGIKIVYGDDVTIAGNGSLFTVKNADGDYSYRLMIPSAASPVNYGNEADMLAKAAYHSFAIKSRNESFTDGRYSKTISPAKVGLVVVDRVLLKSVRTAGNAGPGGNLLVLASGKDRFIFTLSMPLPDDMSDYESLVIRDHLSELFTLHGASAKAGGVNLDPLLSVSNGTVTLTLPDTFDFNAITGESVVLEIEASIRADASEADLTAAANAGGISNVAYFSVKGEAPESSNTARVNIPKTPAAFSKTVSVEESAPAETARISGLQDAISYTIRTELPLDVGGWNNFTIEDTLPNILEISDAEISSVDLFLEEDNVGTLAISGNTVAYSVSDPADFNLLKGRELILTIKAVIAQGISLKEIEAEYGADGSIPNFAIYSLNHGDPVQSNTVQIICEFPDEKNPEEDIPPNIVEVPVEPPVEVPDEPPVDSEAEETSNGGGGGNTAPPEVKVEEEKEKEKEKEEEEEEEEENTDYDKKPGPSSPPAAAPGNSLIPGPNGTYIEIDENDTPLGEWHYDDESDTWIFDEYPPLGKLPQTGAVLVPDTQGGFTPALPLLALLWLVFTLQRLRRRDDNRIS